ncbi:MAG: response regulator transcription factor [Gammaproteobacteria bacterium]|nr:response regulator transcription factor [Gammaproteobacteria bacterium]
MNSVEPGRHIMKIRIVLADDHVIVRDGLRSLLERHTDMETVAEAANGLEAVRVAKEHQPHVIVMDASMPTLNGIEATRQIRAQLSEVRIICLSMHAENQFVSAMLKAGASGYLLKDCASEELVSAIHVVMSGQVYLSPGIGQVVANHFKARSSDAIPSAFSILTDKERAVLQLLAEGHSTKEIGERLSLSAKTIATHREHIMEKLGIQNIAGLTKYAIQQGLTTLDF